MNYIIAGLAVYKLIQVLDLLTPREAMPWVKVVLAVAISYGISFVVQIDELWTSGLVVATLAGATHTLLRLLTLTGDMAQRRSMK
jgi:hypothetical protein